ncbi:hypothetical protein DH2020_026675 [Rehmannia glutinosa]|uniref:Mitochondrial glycoprotein n=1 Tax=Rehmannia glutinosa TaxID=99300 RepID=A0ABR0W0B0_REHGL
MALRLVRGLRGAVKNVVLQQQSKPVNHFLKSSTRNYVSEMRKSAFESNILRLIRNEIQYELDHSPPSEHTWIGLDSKQTNITLFQNSRSLYMLQLEILSSKLTAAGEQWIRLSGKFGEKEEIKIEVTMFDGSIPMKKNDDSEDVKLHITLIIDIFKGKDSNILEFVCSAWPDSIEIKPSIYTELDDELQDSLYDFLEARGVDDKLAEFLHLYMRNKDKNEYLRWMENVKSFIQKK